jgi:hypothetical protein
MAMPPLMQVVVWPTWSNFLLGREAAWKNGRSDWRLILFVAHAGPWICEETIMKRIRLDALTIFLLFFGVATVETFQTRNWLKAAFWMAIGVVFLVADNLRLRTDNSSTR